MRQGTFSPHRNLSEAGDWSCTPTILLQFFSGMPDPLKKQEVLPFQLFLSLPAFKSSCKSCGLMLLMLKKSTDENVFTFLYFTFMRLLNNTRIKIFPKLSRKKPSTEKLTDTVIRMKSDDGNQCDFLKYYKASE